MSLASSVENLTIDGVTMIENGVTNIGACTTTESVRLKNAVFKNLTNIAEGNKYFGAPSIIDSHQISGTYTIE